MKISQLKSNPNNPRLIKDDKFKKLVTSLREFPEMMEKLQSEGYRCEVCRSFDEFRNVVDNYML